MGESNPCSPGMSPFCWTDIPLLPVGWVKPRLTPCSKGSEPLQEGLVPLPRKVWLHHSHHVSCLQTHPRALGEAGDDADGGWRTTRDPRQRQKEMCPGNSLLGCSSTVLTVFPASKITPKHWRWCKVWLEGQGRDPRQRWKEMCQRNLLLGCSSPTFLSAPSSGTLTQLLLSRNAQCILFLSRWEKVSWFLRHCSHAHWESWNNLGLSGCF